MSILVIMFAPTLCILYFVWRKDRYDREPMKLLIQLFFLGVLSSIFAVIGELVLIPDTLPKNQLIVEIYTAFIGVALVEEGVKYVMLYFRTRKHKAFNQFYDGIVYAVFVSLGFATIENVFYIIGGGFSVGLLRAFLAVPGHGIFGVAMGYYYSKAHFQKKGGQPYRSDQLKAILVPVLLHGFYDFVLMTHLSILLLAFIPYVIYLYRYGLKHIKEYALLADQIVMDDQTLQDESVMTIDK